MPTKGGNFWKMLVFLWGEWGEFRFEPPWEGERVELNLFSYNKCDPYKYNAYGLYSRNIDPVTGQRYRIQANRCRYLSSAFQNLGTQFKINNLHSKIYPKQFFPEREGTRAVIVNFLYIDIIRVTNINIGDGTWVVSSTWILSHHTITQLRLSPSTISAPSIQSLRKSLFGKNILTKRKRTHVDTML